MLADVRDDSKGDKVGLPAMSASPPTTDIGGAQNDVSFVPIVLQKSKVAGPRLFRENTKREVIADSYNLNRVTEVACEFYARR